MDWAKPCDGHIELTQPDVLYLEPPMLLRNMRGKFQDMSERSGAPFQTATAARGVAFGDLDNDGCIDVVVNSDYEPARILRCRPANRNHWLIVNTAGTKSNHYGIGARIRIVPETGPEQYGFVSTAGSYLSASDKRVHFGLGNASVVTLLEITWPSGVQQRVENVAANQSLTVREP